MEGLVARKRPIDPDSTVQERINAAVAARCTSIKGYRDDIPGVFFRSRWEANYARYLAHQVNVGLIERWAHEPTTFWFTKIKRGVVSYKPDFIVVDASGRSFYVEVKGWMDPKSKTKLKRMAKYFPEIDLRLVDEKDYRKLEKEIGSSIPGWEFPVKRVKPKKAEKTVDSNVA